MTINPKIWKVKNYNGLKVHFLKSECGFYVKKGINFMPRKDLALPCIDEENEFQCSCIEILNEKRHKILVRMYLFSKTKKSLARLHNSSKVTLVTEDFSYDILKHEKNTIINKFLNLMHSNFFQYYNLEAAGVIADRRPSLMNTIFINTLD